MKQKFSSFFLTVLLGLSGMQAWALDKDSNGVYQIGTAQDLADFAALVNDGEYSANAVLTADINMSGVTMTPIGKDENDKRYDGTFDGQGHYISNLTMENTTATPYGLFLSIWKGKLKNFYLDNTCSINGGGNVGLVGSINGAAVGDAVLENVGNAGNVTSNTVSKNDGGNVGGLVGGIWRKATFNNCWTAGTVTAPDTPNKNAGAFCGWVNTSEKATFNDCWGGATLPRYTAGTYLSRRSKVEHVVFNNCYAKTGSQIAAEDNCCIIDSGKELAWFSKFVNFGGTSATAKLTADIDMDGVTIDPIGTTSKRYTGKFDGQGHTIKNLTITRTANATGLFNTGANVVLRDFFLDSTCTITGQAQTGVIGDHNGKNALFEKIGSAAKIVSTTGGNVGGLIGGCWCGNPGVVNINACWTVGTISSDGSFQNNCGQFVGWQNQGTLNFTSCWSIATMNHWQSYANYWARFGGTLNFTNCYSTLGTQVPNIVSADVASGRLCFLLNSGTESPVWFQTLSSDKTPVLDSTHGTVYASYNIDCDGATLTAGTLGYSNTATSDMTGQPMRDHNYVDGVCTQCGQTQADANNYTISTADQLRHFACGVAAGNRAINATLAADIDMADLGDVEMPIIGEGDNYFGGTFDGKGHAIHNYKLTSDKEYAGFIGYLYGSTVKDFSIDGEMTLSATNAGGLIGRTNSVCTISDVHSTINITAAGSAIDRLGGIIGYANGSKTTVTRCSYGGTMTIPVTFGNSAGGIIGGGYNNLVIDACVFYGKVNATGTGKATNFGGMIGYFNSTVATGITNCLAAGTVETEEGREFTNLRGILASQSGSQSHDIYSIITNCYYTDLGAEVATATPEDAKVGSATKVTAEKMARGEIAYTLNGNQSGGTWTQTLGTQCAPLPISSGDKVYPYAKSGDNQYFVNKTSAPVVPVMTLTDGADFTAEGNFTATSLSCNRTLYKGYNSVCMPFAINTDMLGEGSKIFAVATVGTEDVTLEETTEAAAGQPCIVSVTADCTPFTALSKVAMTSAPDNSGSMKGSFTKQTISEGKYKLSSDGSYFGQTSEGAIVGAFRSYIDAPSSVKTLNIVLEGTGIEEVSENGASKAQTIYDLSGRRVNNATKGIYIINGKKILK